MPRVVILQKSLPQYRETFFTSLKERLAVDNIILELIYGDLDDNRKDKARIEWATFKKNRYFIVGPLKLIWQPCVAEIKSADLVIVEQADKLLINYLLFFRKTFGQQKIAFWGLGRHMQSRKFGLKNLFKHIFINRCDWWFAYTNGVRAYLIKNGYPANQITVVQNAIDTKEMYNSYRSITNDELDLTRKEIGLRSDEKLLIYCGALYRKKRLDFLIQTTDNLIKLGYKIKLVIVGSGKDEQLIKDAAVSRPYIIMAGPLFGQKKAKMFKLSSLFLIPGAIGLAVLDSFAFETPIVTTNYKYHGVELEYMVNGYNGLVTENDLSSYTRGITNLLDNEETLKKITGNCKTEIDKYSNENMVNNFAEGIRFFFQNQRQ